MKAIVIGAEFIDPLRCTSRWWPEGGDVAEAGR